MGPIESELRRCPHYEPRPVLHWLLQAPEGGGCSWEAFNFLSEGWTKQLTIFHAADAVSSAIEAAEALGL